MRRAAVLLATLALALAAPGAALAQSNPFVPPIQANGTPAPAPTPVPTTTPQSNTLSSTATTTLYVIGALILLSFVAVGIWIARDARRALREVRGGPGEPLAADGPARRRPVEAKQRTRARGRAQRRARRRNR